MRRVVIAERPDWRATAERHGFRFHTIDGQRYWDEGIHYAFTLEQIENDIEAPTEELHELAMDLVAEVVDSDELLARLAIPAPYRDWVRRSWHEGEPHLYGRMDFAYDGRGPAKLYELNYDTPTALYEAAFFQWLWLEQQIERGALPPGSDQYNSIQEGLVEAFGHLAPALHKPLYFSAVRDSAEDQGTVDYLRDCAEQAGLASAGIAIEDIGLSTDGRLTDLDDRVIRSLSKLYPLEYLFEDEFGRALPGAGVRLIEPAWKACWPTRASCRCCGNAIAAIPTCSKRASSTTRARRSSPVGCANLSFRAKAATSRCALPDGRRLRSGGPDTQGPWIEQRFHPLPDFDGQRPLLGSWVVADRACGLGVREDATLITQDTSRFVPHAILPSEATRGDDRIASALEAFSRRGLSARGRATLRQCGSSRAADRCRPGLRGARCTGLVQRSRIRGVSRGRSGRGDGLIVARCSVV